MATNFGQNWQNNLGRHPTSTSGLKPVLSLYSQTSENVNYSSIDEIARHVTLLKNLYNLNETSETL